jgi:hypothetical protein
MKKIALLATAFIFTLAVSAQTNADNLIKMNVEKHDFGKVKQGDPTTYEFVIKNISNSPVVVENTWASCGCTTPGKIEEPIMPGASAKMKVEYDSKRVGPISKDVYIKIAGVDQPKSVHISGEILTPEAYEEYMKTKKGK